MKGRNVLWLCLVLVVSTAVPVFAADSQIDFQAMYDRIKTLVTAFNILAWLAVFIGWAMGIFTRILPVPSRVVKQTGQEWTEWAGIGAFLLAAGLTVINVILWIFGVQLPQGI
jgi:hypothetical protein